MSLLKGKKSLKKKKNSKKEVGQKKKQAMTLNEFAQSFQSLDNNNYGSWPLVVKVTVMVLIVLVIAALTYFIPVKNKLNEIRAAESEKTSLLETYREKESKARHLKEYKNQIAQMEVEFNSLLDQLPKDTRVSELVQGINMTGVGSNIRFKKITVEPEIQQEFFIEQPIEIQASGDYHQFGSFISGLAALPRIITMHDFEVKNQSNDMKLDDISDLQLVLNTRTYRSKAMSTESDTSKDAAKGDAKK